MTITKEGLRIVITCDGCGLVRRDQGGIARPRFRRNKEVWKEATDAGWMAKENGRDWKHFCPACK
jgi:hypothetical protein